MDDQYIYLTLILCQRRESFDRTMELKKYCIEGVNVGFIMRLRCDIYLSGGPVDDVLLSMCAFMLVV